MKREELFTRTVEVLVNAYNNNMLIHGDCRACAVGNMVYGATGERTGGWYNILMPAKNSFLPITKEKCEDIYNNVVQHSTMYENWKDYLSEINSTGYTLYELLAIEAAFESQTLLDERRLKDDPTVKNGMYGLRAVYDTLLKIHEVEVDVEEIAKAEEVFA